MQCDRQTPEQDEASKQVQEEMKVFEEVKSGINVIRRNVQLIDGLKMQSNKTFDQKVFQGAIGIAATSVC